MKQNKAASLSLVQVGRGRAQEVLASTSMARESQRSAEAVLSESGFTSWSPRQRSFHPLIDLIALISPAANTALFLAYPGQALSQLSTRTD